MNRANDPLEKAKEILRVFLEDFEEVRQHISPPASYWEKDDAYTWIYADRRYPPLMHRMGRTRALPSFYSQPLQPLFDKWLAKVLDVQNIPTYRIPDPLDSEKVHAYLERLQSIVRDEKERRKIWWHSLRSFTRFLRDEARNQIEVLGELDVIFPEDMTIHFDMIIRKVPITLYPIDVWAAADILKILSRFVLEGRPNAQESAAQALGLAWACLASGNARFMTRLELLHELHPSSVQEMNQDDPFKPNHWLKIRTLFGKLDAPISKTLHDYLLALPTINPHYIFSQPLRTLRRTLDRAIAASTQTKDLGKITFLTLMHQCHEGRGHRFNRYIP